MKRYYVEMSVFIEAANGTDAEIIAQQAREAAESVTGVTSASAEEPEFTADEDDEG